MSHKPTGEQAAVVAAFTTGKGLVVEAGAGAGKTSTLKLCAAATPSRRGLYLAYNRALKDEAARSFPSTVRASTTHGLAYGPVATQYMRAGRAINGPRQPARDVALILGINEPLRLGKDLAPLAPTQISRLANQTVARFCMSGSEQLEPWHVPTVPGMEDKAIRAELRRAVLPHAQRAWADITATNGKLRFVHNHYLKIFQLSHPQLRGDYLLVDEAQDLNPCVAALVAEQTDLQVVYVGDSCQAINGWNGAVDAMRDAPGDRLLLSKSFRFGPAIAAEANKWLTLLGARMRLTGHDPIPSRVGPHESPAAILCRTNAEAVAQAGAAVAAGRAVALVGGGDDIRSLAEAALDLMAGRGTGHPELCAFPSWSDVQAYVAQDAAGADLKVAVSLIDSYGPGKVLQLLDGLVDETRAQLVVSTAHKAKGREWSSVRIADDFKEPRDERLPREDGMLAYVAVTRAQEVLVRGGLDWVDRWLAPMPAASWLAAAARQHPGAILPDGPELLADLADRPDVAECRRCGCTEDDACPGGCQWAGDEEQTAAGLDPMMGDLCTACLAGIIERDAARAARGLPTAGRPPRLGDELDGVGTDYRSDPAERIAAVAAVAPEYVRPVESAPAAVQWAPHRVPTPAPRRPCPDCDHLITRHLPTRGRVRCVAPRCGCTRVPETAGAA